MKAHELRPDDRVEIDGGSYVVAFVGERDGDPRVFVGVRFPNGIREYAAMPGDEIDAVREESA